MNTELIERITHNTGLYQNVYGYFISCQRKEQVTYLHNDGIWRENTVTDSTSGYFATLNEARETYQGLQYV